VALTIRRIERSGTDAAFALLQSVARWLDGRGRRQRIAATSFETYLGWQASESNWGLFDDDELAAIFTLVREPLHDWPDIPVDGAVPWLRALAVDPTRRGHGLGTTAVGAALELVDVSEQLYLDCVSDFLPDYYASHGFEHVARQVRTYPDGEYDITLMRQPGRKA
jgi:GNAT superfamily N-acetyltransferase